MEPMKRNMIMKNVAGFHSFDFDFFADLQSSGCSERRRSGFGMRDFQKAGWAMVGAELAFRMN